jgi:hypothetical protein
MISGNIQGTILMEAITDIMSRDVDEFNWIFYFLMNKMEWEKRKNNNIEEYLELMKIGDADPPWGYDPTGWVDETGKTDLDDLIDAIKDASSNELAVLYFLLTKVESHRKTRFGLKEYIQKILDLGFKPVWGFNPTRKTKNF